MKPWRWIWEGKIPSEAIGCRFSPDSSSPPAKLAAAVADHWAQKLASALPGTCLFDGRLAQFLGCREVGGRLEIRLSSSSYSFWLHSAGRQEEVEERFGRGCASRPLAVCAAVESSDGFLVLQERSGQVAEGAGLLHVPGGHLDPGCHLRDGLPDPATAMRAELREELSLGDKDLAGELAIGLIENLENGKPELIFRYQCPLTGQQITEQAQSGPDRFEYSRLLLLPVGREAVSAFLVENEARIAVPARAALSRLIELSQPD